jgi:DNA polymerase III delta prime subunit
MQSRFGLRVGTSLPSEAELQDWIQNRCQEWSIKIIEEGTSIPRIMKRSRRRVGFVIQFLAAAAARGRVIDPEWVEQYNLGPED